MMAPAPYGMDHHYGSPPNLESPSKQWTPPCESRIIDQNRLPANEPVLHRSQIIYISLLCPNIHGQPQHAWSTSIKTSSRVFRNAALPTITAAKSLPTINGAYTHKSDAHELRSQP